ncbi:hypothetical protein KSF78_0009478 [Schistosoma japonicum]|nr:hypothetical protein KSF78_0009478 [Schistosoma japonicum]
MMLKFLLYISMVLILINESTQNSFLNGLAQHVTLLSEDVAHLAERINKELASENRTINEYIKCTSTRFRVEYGLSILQGLYENIKWESEYRNKSHVAVIVNWIACLDKLIKQFTEMKLENTEEKCNALAAPYPKDLKQLEDLITFMEIQIVSFNYYFVDLYVVSDIIVQIENKTRTRVIKYL